MWLKSVDSTESLLYWINPLIHSESRWTFSGGLLWQSELPPLPSFTCRKNILMPLQRKRSSAEGGGVFKPSTCPVMFLSFLLVKKLNKTKKLKAKKSVMVVFQADGSFMETSRICSPQSSSTVGVMVTPLLICPQPIRLKRKKQKSWLEDKKHQNTDA